MAFSDNFYTDADRQSRLTQRSFNLISGHYSQNFSSPSTRSGGVVKQAFLTTNLDVYDYLFSPGSAYNGVDRSILNHVRDSYNRLRRHPRISRGDLIRLDQHIERMAEIERKLVVAQNLANMPQRPAQIQPYIRSTIPSGTTPVRSRSVVRPDVRYGRRRV